MSHELMNRTTGTVIADGTVLANKQDAAMFYVSEDAVRDLPWHGLGKPVSSALCAADALKASGGDYTVEARDLFDADMKKVEGHRLITRTDNNAHLGIVGMRYTPIQNADAFGILDSIITRDGESGAIFETAGALGNGERFFITARLPKDILVAGEKIVPFFHCFNTHDGSGRLKLYLAPTRQVCANTVAMALSQGKNDGRIYGITHTRNYDKAVAEAAKALGFITDNMKAFETQANMLARQKFTQSQFEKLMDELMPLPEDQETKAWTIAERDRNRLHDAYNANDLDNIRDTKWGAFNAIADFSDHGRYSRGDEMTRLENSFLRTFDSTALKDNALELLLAK